MDNSPTIVGNINAATIRFNTAGANTLTLSAGNNIVSTGGILVTSNVGANVSTITGGNLLGSSGGDLIIHQNNGSNALSIGSIIKDNSTATGLTKSGSGTLILNGVNTFTGGIAINAGTLQIGTNGTANGASLNSGNYVGNIFIGAGASLDFQTNVTQILGGDISGNGNLLVRYNGTITLSGNNTYTGTTTIGAITNAAGAGTLVVSSFNSVSNPMASSSLGRPTTVANGTIQLGSNNSSPNPTLRYVGNGETTDRVVNFIFNIAANRTLDASGASGVLKFTSPFTSNGTTTGGIILTGTGNGEIVGGLPFAFTNLAKSGNGTWTLGGAVANTGATTVSGGTLILSGTGSTNAGAYTVTSATLRGTTSTAFGNTTNINIGGSGILQLHGDANATFGKTTGGAAYTTSITATGATINVDQNTVAGTNQTFTLGAQTITSTAATVNAAFTGANNTSLILGAVTDTTAASGTIQFTNNISGAAH